MKQELVTPLGKIHIYADGVCREYQISPHHSRIRSLRENPPAGCYRITVSGESCKRICCVVASGDNDLANIGSTGERYCCSEYVKDNVNLVIGAADDHPAFETNRLRYGMEYVLNTPMDEVSFGIAWVVDYEGEDDIRAYLAADLF